MRLRLAAGLVAVLLAAMPTALVAPSPANAAVSPAIVLFYKVDAHQGAAVPDTSLSQLTGSLVNSATPDSAYVAGLAGHRQALKLVAAQRQYVAVPEANALDVNRFTLSALVRYTGVQTPDTLDRW